MRSKLQISLSIFGTLLLSSTAIAEKAFSNNGAANKVITELVEQHHFDRDYVTETFAQAAHEDSAIKLLTKAPLPSKPPSAGSWSRYLKKFLTDYRIEHGVKFWNKYRSTLAKASKQYGIPAEYIVAILGVESAYGKQMGRMRTLDALATGAFNKHRRQDLFLKEIVQFMLMCREERIDPRNPKGSYAGAMGYGQFLPSSIRRFAVDFDNSGRKNIWEPVDAIGSVANYFHQHGWQNGEAFTVPVKIKGDSYQNLKTGWRGKYTLAEFHNAGVYPKNDYQSKRMSFILLRHDNGNEYRVGGNNFYVITRYNNSTNYAMAVHALAQAIKSKISK